MKKRGLDEIMLDRLDLGCIEGVFGGGLWRGWWCEVGVANYGKPVETLGSNFFLTILTGWGLKAAALGYGPC